MGLVAASEVFLFRSSHQATNNRGRPTGQNGVPDGASVAYCLLTVPDRPSSNTSQGCQFWASRPNHSLRNPSYQKCRRSERLLTRAISSSTDSSTLPAGCSTIPVKLSTGRVPDCQTEFDLFWVPEYARTISSIELNYLPIRPSARVHIFGHIFVRRFFLACIARQTRYNNR